MLRMTQDTRTKMCDAITANIDAASPAATHPASLLQIFQGTVPSVPDSALAGDCRLLAQLQWDGAAFGSATNGKATAASLDPAVILRTGTAQWFRILDKSTSGVTGHAVVGGQNRQIVLDGLVSATGGGGDLELDSISFVAGGTVVINTLTLTVPTECQ